MATSNVFFNRGEGGLGRPLSGEDHISGLIYYIADADLPAGFSATDRIKQIFSLSQAENLGIVKGSATTAVLYYHIEQFFLQQPNGQLYVGLYDNAAIDYTAIESIQTFANGSIRQVGVYDGDTALAIASVNSLQSSAEALRACDQPLVVLYAADISAVTDLSLLDDMSALNAPNVGVVIGQDGSGEGAALYASEGKSITSLGAALGVLSKASVHENLGFVGKFDIVQGAEYEEPAFANGVIVKTLPKAQIEAIGAQHYIFNKKYIGISGTYFNDAYTAISETSDFATLENMRAIQKCERGVRSFLLPFLNGPIYVNTDGTLSEDTIAEYKAAANRALDPIRTAGEISNKAVLIDPTQNVLATSQVELSIQIQPVGVARKILVNIGFAVKVASAS